MIEISLAVVHLFVVVLVLVTCARTKNVQVATTPSEVPTTPEDDADNSLNFVKPLGSERPSGKFRGIDRSPSSRYATIVQKADGKNVIFPLFVVDVCRSSYSIYTADESDERIEQLRNSNFYWLADDMIVVVQYKNDQLIRYIYELDHKKKTVIFVYKGKHPCKFPVQATRYGNIELHSIDIENRRYILIVGTDFQYFQVFHRDPRVDPKYSHAFYLNIQEIRQHLLLAHDDCVMLTSRLCGGSKMRFELLKRCDGLHDDGSAIWAPDQLLTFDLERIFEKQPDALTDTVTIDAGDEDCWSIAALKLDEPDIVLRKPYSFLTSFPTHGVHICGKQIDENSGTHFYAEIEMVLIDFNTMKCSRESFCTKRQKLTPGSERMVTITSQLHPFPRLEQWIWDEVRGGPCWSTLKSFPPTVVPSLQDICRDVIMKNREKYSEDLPDYAGILFPE